MNELSRGMCACAECGMVVEMCEYHPYAACLMFKQCSSSIIVRKNLKPVVDFGAKNSIPISKIEELMKGDNHTYAGDSYISGHKLQRLIDETKQ